MDTQLIDVFVSYSRADAGRVESWIRRLREGGVRVWFDDTRDNGGKKWKMSARTAAERCEVLIWFVSKFTTVSREAGGIAAAASNNGKAVLIVELDTTPVTEMFDVSQPGVSLVDALLLGREAAWEAVLKGVRGQGVPWVDPARKRRLSPRPNELRSSVTSRAWLRASIASLMILSVAAFVWLRPKHARPTVAAPSPAMIAADAQPPLLTVVPEAAPAAPPSPPPPPAVPPAIPVEVSPALEDPESKRAIEYVTRCIGAAGREHGLTPEQIDAAASYFADPVRIEGKGLQPKDAIKATLQSSQQDWPRWRETIHFIKAEAVPGDPTCREVTAQISYAGESPVHDTTSGVVRQHYVVDFTAEETPKITQLWIEDQKPQ